LSKERARPVVSTVEILKFYLPIASTNMIIGIVFNIINATMTGAADATAALAAFAVAQSMTDLTSTLSSNSPSWLTARVRDKKSFMMGLRRFIPLTLLNVVLLGLVAWTPLGEFVFSGIFRAPTELSAGISAALKICVIMPIVLVLRGCSQSVLMVRKRTYLMFFGIFSRLVGVALGAPLLMRQTVLKGAQIGAFMWVASMCIEATCDFIMATRHFHEYPDEPPAGRLPKASQIWSFVIPLVLVSIVQALGKPVQNLGMAWTNTPVASIASYSVGWSGAWLLVAFAQDGLRQTVLVFWNDDASFAVIRNFFLKASFIVAALILIFSVTGVWTWFFEAVIHADMNLANMTKAAMYVFAVYPLVLSMSEVHTGRLLRNGATGLMAYAKGANLIATAIGAFVISSAFPGGGAAVGAGCLLLGVMAELCVVYIANRSIHGQPTL
jgi:progressive ankylosis protein